MSIQNLQVVKMYDEYYQYRLARRACINVYIEVLLTYD